MTGVALYNLDKPDEQTDLNLKDASQKEIIEKTFDTWFNTTEELREKLREDDGDVDEPLYRQACRIIRPFRKKIIGNLHTDNLIFLADYEKDLKPEEYSSKGHYLSALQNETNIEKLSIGKFPAPLNDVGYRLKPGKTVEVLEDGKALCFGVFAQGGTIINHGTVEANMGWHHPAGTLLNFGKVGKIGTWASGGVHLNYGTVKYYMGWNASGGIHINHGIVKEEMGCDANGGLYLNYGTVKKMGDPWASGCTFVIKTKLKGNFNDFRSPNYSIGPKELKKDKKLSRLMDQAELASKASDIPKVEELARKVDAHVRKKYNPRKVA